MENGIKRRELERRYESGRANLLLIVALTFINVILVLVNAGISFLFSATLPQFGAAFAGYLTGFGYWGDLLLCCGLPLALGLLCWLLSEKRAVGWLIAAASLFGLDCVYLLTLVVQMGVSGFLLDIAFHAYCMWSLVSGCIAGVKLARAGEPDPMEAFAEMNAEAFPELAGAPSAEEQSGVYSAKVTFRYDRGLAKQNRALRGGALAACVLALLIGVPALAILIAETVPESVAPIASLVLVFGEAVALVVAVVKFAPFLQAPQTAYFGEGGGLVRVSGMGRSLRMDRPVLEQELPDRLVVSYVQNKQGVEGRRARVTIPNAYPGLAGYLHSLQLDG